MTREDEPLQPVTPQGDVLHSADAVGAAALPPLITLTTDFGEGSPYVAQMKGVILSINPAARIVDISHAVPPQDIRRGAQVLAEATPLFPPGTLHVAVVDPGVGSVRELLYAEFGDQRYLAPDNGLLSGLALRANPSTIIAIENRQHWRPDVSATFHGRDILAPVAAHLSLGLAPVALGSPRTEFRKLQWPEARIVANQIEGEVVSIDSFGNLITNITAEMLERVPDPNSATIRCDEHETIGIFRTYADQPPMTLIALVGSSGQLELAIVDDSAKLMLGCREGERVIVAW